jgi:hypothetical protein
MLMGPQCIPECPKEYIRENPINIRSCYKNCRKIEIREGNICYKWKI